jgi:glutamine synthetase
LLGIGADTLLQEVGCGQLEINLQHGDAIALADQAFLFKRMVREAAARHDLEACFMAKPLAEDAGSAMHIHKPGVCGQWPQCLLAGQRPAGTPL